MSREQQLENDGQLPDARLSPDRKPDVQYLDPLSVESSNCRSPALAAVELFVKPAVLFFPVAGADFDWIA